ncbi:MAG: filamentous hemagglutinin, partial [Pseudomonadota bacterium]
VTGSNLLPGQSVKQLDGATLTTGYMTELSTGARDATWSTFKVTDGAIFRPATGTVSKAPSQYLLTSATTFFSNPLKTNGQDVSLPLDVGRLGLDATKLTLDSTVVANKKAGGSGLQVDISSSNIRVVSSAGVDDGSLQLTADSINALNAESLLLGGSRALQNGVVDVTTSAETVSIENDSNHVIKVPEFIATALNSVAVKTGAAVNTGAAAKSPAKKVINANGDGALLALSSSNDITYSRTGGSPTSAQGELNIEDGSILKAGNSVVLDATKSANLKGNVALQDGGSATLGANRILIGNAPIDILGLNVNAAALSALGQLKALTLNSYNNIDTYGAVNIGNENLDLTMNSAGIVGHLAQGEVAVPTNAAASVITARNFTIKNTQDAAFTASDDPSGRGLEINAKNVKFDGGLAVNGKTNIDGFSNLDIKSDEIRVSNQGEINFNVAETKLTTARLTADTAANYKVTSTGKLEIAKPAVDAANKTSNGFGAQLAVSANDLKVSGNIDLSSGILSLTSTHDLNVESGAVISATSTANIFYDKTVYASAGSVTLTSTTANVNVNTGALVDVTSRGEANAGLVKVVATSGTANIAGQLNGTAVGTGNGGVLDVDVSTLADLTVTNKQASGFSEDRQYRVRTGDVNISGSIASGNELAAREVIVSADAGNITVSGDIIATAPKNSRIGLFAGDGVTLASTANLKANSTKANEEGGKVDIETKAGPLDFKVGSKVNTAGAAGGKDGQVYLGAARTVDNLDINVANMDTTFTGARKIDIGGLDSIETDKVNTANQTTAFDQAEAFMKSVVADSTKGLQRLGLASDERFAIVPVVEFKNTNE